MKKIILILLVLVSVFLFQTKKESEQIRVRVIGNSNNQSDISIKMEVKDKLLEIIDPLISDDLSKTQENIESNLLSIERTLNEIASCKLSFDIEFFPVKVLNKKLLDGKSIRTLKVMIEDAEGDNWWSTLYPKQSGISENVEKRSFIKDQLEEIWG